VGEGEGKVTNAEGSMRVKERPVVRRGICSLEMMFSLRTRQGKGGLTGQRRERVLLRG
jgi:hypothetical protein